MTQPPPYGVPPQQPPGHHPQQGYPPQQPVGYPQPGYPPQGQQPVFGHPQAGYLPPPPPSQTRTTGLVVGTLTAVALLAFVLLVLVISVTN